MKISETLYTRKEFPSGRVRYIPILERFPADTFGSGSWIIRVTPGITSTTRAITPDRPGLCAAIEEAREAMLDALQEASRGSMPHRVTTQEEQTAYQLYEEACRKSGFDPYPIAISHNSAWDIIDATLKALKENDAA